MHIEPVEKSIEKLCTYRRKHLFTLSLGFRLTHFRSGVFPRRLESKTITGVSLQGTPALEASMEPAKPCPRCHSDEVVPILYGMPSPEVVEEPRAGRVKLGGCVTWPEAPDWHCVACGHEWRGDEAEL